MDQDQLVKNTLASAKSEYYNKKNKASKGNQRTVFSVVNKVLHKSQTVLPNNINSDKDMAHCFNNFFCQKILNIHSGLQSSTLSQGKPLVEESSISIYGYILAFYRGLYQTVAEKVIYCFLCN